MKSELQQITPTEGLGQLKFGMTRAEVRSVLGEPDEINEYEFGEDPADQSEAWHYDDLELSMSFDADDDWRMITLAISSDFYKWDEQPLIGMARENLITLLSSKNITDLEFEDSEELDMPDTELISSPDLSINFWLENDRVKEIQWSPLFTDDEEVEWPK